MRIGLSLCVVFLVLLGWYALGSKGELHAAGADHKRIGAYKGAIVFFHSWKDMERVQKGYAKWYDPSKGWQQIPKHFQEEISAVYVSQGALVEMKRDSGKIIRLEEGRHDLLFQGDKAWAGIRVRSK